MAVEDHCAKCHYFRRASVNEPCRSCAGWTYGASQTPPQFVSADEDHPNVDRDDVSVLSGLLAAPDTRTTARWIADMIDRRIAAAMTQPEPAAPGVVAVSAAVKRDRIQELLEANNRLLERARAAEAVPLAILTGIRKRRELLHQQTVVIDIDREDAIYEICEDIARSAFSKEGGAA